MCRFWEGTIENYIALSPHLTGGVMWIHTVTMGSRSPHSSVSSLYHEYYVYQVQ